MLIYNGIITLDYTPSTDVLVTSMPDVRQFGLSEVSFCLGLIVENITNYDIKHLLLDSSNSIVDVEEQAYRAISMKFAMDLMGTRLKKIARVGTADAVREEKAAKLSAELTQELNPTMVSQSFSSQAEAMAWLLSSARA
ncbi:hypothetical protein MKJ04_00580 [Pontibacter sp. E15-1]|uniref:hypothetical protein n=1 Tax=Pontibacter sp. E15-1 TaxID=2919918 RepID=UPI001F4FE5AB|nr:hypothetical protein [Pontibacter sp. E15-1]MCJ8163318.1 hypothetical protein [Pontibacter sp. E15-1]